MTIDIEHVKTRTDIVRVAEGYTSLRKSGRHWIGKCPIPGHHDSTPSFVVYEESQSWHCYGCGEGGDVINLVMLAEGLQFRRAVEVLGGDVEHKPLTPRPPLPQGERGRKADAVLPPDGTWQEAARQVIAAGEHMLWSDAGARARRWLMEVRGLREETIRAARLGYVPGGYAEWVTMAGLSVPCGVLIPWVIDGDVWGLKVRRAAGKIKYQQVAGGKVMQALYRVDQVESWHTVLIVEGEFDALVVAQASRLVVPVALGTAGNTLRDHWMGRLLCCPAIYARLDKDDSGQKSLARLRAISARVRGVQVPDPHKDLNDYWLADADGFRQWVQALEVLE